MKIVLSDPKSGRSASIDVPAERTAQLLNLKIGDTFDGSAAGLAGYKLKVTGGSDRSGFPMKRGIDGTRKAKIFAMGGSKARKSGQYSRRSARGNTTSVDIEQLNTVIVEYGDRPVDEIFPKKAEATKDVPEQAKA